MTRTLTTDQREALCEAADDVFELMLRISDGEHLYFLADGERSAYSALVDSINRMLCQLGVHPADLNVVMEEMGNGSHAEEAIETVRAERENTT